MYSRLDFMGNGYAGQLLDRIRSGRSVQSILSVYDFMAFRSQVGNLDGVSVNEVTFEGFKITVFDGKAGFVTTVSGSNQLANGTMQFIDRYSVDAYLLYDGLNESGYLVTENNELLLV